jgi:hypothetical protein
MLLEDTNVGECVMSFVNVFVANDVIEKNRGFQIPELQLGVA